MELQNLNSYAVQNGIEQIPLHRSFSNRTLTTTFDLDITYSNITVDNFWNIIGNPTIVNDLAGGSFYSYLTTDVLLSGTFVANGTILGVPTSQSGRWSGRIRATSYYFYQYTLTGDFVDLRLNIPGNGGTSSPSLSGFTADLFNSLHPLKQPFDSLLQTQLSAIYLNSWRLDLFPYLTDFFNDKLGIASFQQLITSQLPTTSPAVPLPTTPLPLITTTTPSPFQCEADGCLLDYVRLKFSRFPDWVDSANRDPLELPGSYRVQFAIWDIDLFLE
ncbi:uncharacterized protein LOC118437820 [Folsomia candida]|nr:uncharacterized protein LOC118437820 [Folsomia candida]